MACEPRPSSGAAEVVEGMVKVPEGSFWRGCSEEVASDLPTVSCESGPDYIAQNVPLREIHLSRFWIDQYEATIGEYVACYEAGICEGIATIQPPDLEPPERVAVGGLNWFQAKTYCEWRGKRLPTEAEWEKAARGGKDTREFPWGNESGEEVCGHANMRLAVESGGCPGWESHVDLVDAYPLDRSTYGVVGMGGNLKEWVEDWAHYDYYAWSSDADPQGPDESLVTSEQRVVRGSYYDAASGLSLRRSLPPDLNAYQVGVRCASSVDPREIDDPLPSTALRTVASSMRPSRRYH